MADEPRFTEADLRLAHKAGWYSGRKTSPHYKGTYHRTFWDHCEVREQLGLGPRGQK